MVKIVFDDTISLKMDDLDLGIISKIGKEDINLN